MNIAPSGADLATWATRLLADVEPLLTTSTLGRTARGVGRTDSTMTNAREWAAAGAPHGAIVVAAAQTRGRGRLDRRWIDSPGASLLCSVLIRSTLPPAQLGLVPIAAGVAAAMAVETACGLRPALKWPNDVLIAGRKAAGILVETQAGPPRTVVIGLGMNVGRASVPTGMEAAATSLADEAGREIAPASVLAFFLNSLEGLVEELSAGDGERVRHEWENRMHGRGDPVAVSATGIEPQVSGTALGLAPDGALRLATDGGEVSLYAGDVTLRMPSGRAS